MQWRALNAEAAQRKHASIPFAALKGSDVRSEARAATGAARGERPLLAHYRRSWRLRRAADMDELSTLSERLLRGNCSNLKTQSF
jgi:hypothetical protein